MLGSGLLLLLYSTCPSTTNVKASSLHPAVIHSLLLSTPCWILPVQPGLQLQQCGQAAFQCSLRTVLLMSVPQASLIHACQVRQAACPKHHFLYISVCRWAKTQLKAGTTLLSWNTRHGYCLCSSLHVCMFVCGDIKEGSQP